VEESSSLQQRDGKREKTHRAADQWERTITLTVGKANEAKSNASLPLTQTRATYRQRRHNQANFKHLKIIHNEVLGRWDGIGLPMLRFWKSSSLSMGPTFSALSLAPGMWHRALRRVASALSASLSQVKSSASCLGNHLLVESQITSGSRFSQKSPENSLGVCPKLTEASESFSELNFLPKNIHSLP